jgi:peptidoglycan hydrolase CwlO-like protein
MNIKRNNKATNKIKFLIIAIAFSAIASVSCYVKAADDPTLSSEDQQKLDELKQKAETYRQIIEIKEKQQDSLANQLSITDVGIQQVQTQIDLSTAQLSDLNSQIIRLQGQIKEKDALISFQKKLLANIVQSYYEANQTGVMAAYLSGRNLASFIVTKDRIAQTGEKIQDLVRSITETKKGLEAQSAQLDQKKNEVVDKSQQLQDQNDKLISVKEQRQTLLTQTQGEEDKYRQLLANVEKQKQELLDIDQFFASSGLSADSYPKPDSKYFASTDWYYSQWDSRWGNETIGNTRTKMKSYGCAVTAVAMVFTEQGVSMNPGKLADQPIYSGDLINWYDSKDWKSSWPVPNSSYGWNHGNISWSVIDSKIKKGIPVIVYIKRSKGGGHYVVIHHKDSKGKYVVHDPYFGANIFLDTSRALVGAMGTSSSTSIDQMIIYE